MRVKRESPAAERLDHDYLKNRTCGRAFFARCSSDSETALPLARRAATVWHSMMTGSGSAQASRAKRRWYHPLALARRVFIIALIGYAGVCGYLFFNQTEMIYEGSTSPLSVEAATREAAAAGLVAWECATPGAVGLQGYVQPNFTSPAPRGTIVFFHGNGESAWLWAEQIAPFTRRGFRVFLYEYPGYGGRPGVPSEKAIVPDAQALVRSLAKGGYGPLYVWGESLGSGVAAAVCADKGLPIHGLTLVTAWDNIANVALSYYPYLPIRPFMIDRYDSIANLENFQQPVCVICGDEDSTVLPALSLNLFAHLRGPKKMILMKGYGHGDWPRSPESPWWDEALDFIAPQARKQPAK
jgi:pimeloyl-ACP methyl ester carboxylesterase